MSFFNRLLNKGTELGVTLIVKAPLESSWATMLLWCVEHGYWVLKSDQTARQFTYFVPNEVAMTSIKGMLASGQQVVVCVASVGAEASAISVTANSYAGESLQWMGKQAEFMSRPRQRELIGNLVAFIESKFSVIRKASTPSI